jgi:hypothetical protein
MRKITITLFVAALLLGIASVYAMKLSEVECFEITPNPMDRECTIYLSFRNQLNISLQIQTMCGDLVKDIYSGPAGKSMEFHWDRNDLKNQYVPDGTYLVVLGYDTRYTSTKKTLILK